MTPQQDIGAIFELRIMKILAETAWSFTAIFFCVCIAMASLLDVSQGLPQVFMLCFATGFVIFFCAGCLSELAKCILVRRIQRVII